MNMIMYGPNQCIWSFPGCCRNLLSQSNTKSPVWNFFYLICLSFQAFSHAFRPCWWKHATKLSSSSSISSNSLFSTAPKFVSFAIAVMRRLGTINSIGITTSCPYVNLNEICPIDILHVVIYGHNIVGIFKSQSSWLMLQTFVSACSIIILKASTVPFSWGCYGVLFWWWILNSFVNVAIVLFKKWFLDHSQVLLG